MHSAARPYSLVARLRLLLWAMLLLPLVAGVAFFLLHSSRVLHQEAVRDLNASLSLERQFIELWLSERVEDMERLAEDPRTQALRGQALQDHLRRQLTVSLEFNNLALVDAAGRTSADALFPTGVDLADRPYFRAAQQGRPFISDMLRSRLNGEPVIVVSAPLHGPDGAFRGLVFGTVSLDTLSTLMRTVQTQSSSRTRLLQADGQTIAPGGRAGERRAPSKGDELYASAKNGRTAPWVSHGADGTRIVGTYQWINDGRWLLTAERAESEILFTHAWVLGVPLLGAALVFLLIGPAVLRLARSLRAPLQQLEEHARQIETGNFEVGCALVARGSAPEEVRRLNQAYCLMVERVRAALEELRAAALTDPMTGAANRARLFGEGPRLMEAAVRGGNPVSALMLDLDHFKRVNDTYGHAAGDAVLVAFAALLQSTLRKSDLFARYGGEEFVVLAPNAGNASVLELAERIRAAVERLQVQVDGASLEFTVSIGAATLEPGQGSGRASGDPLEALLARADEALYAAKAAGRNRVEAAASNPAPAGG
jgi:diguanylate cyclase (GGDEF)-like protein